jgi:hypothetical protein
VRTPPKGTSRYPRANCRAIHSEAKQIWGPLPMRWPLRHARLNKGSAGGGIATSNNNVTIRNSTIRNNTPDNCSPLNTIPGCVN